MKKLEHTLRASKPSFLDSMEPDWLPTALNLIQARQRQFIRCHV
jgi:hypothetical protein